MVGEDRVATRQLAFPVARGSLLHARQSFLFAVLTELGASEYSYCHRGNSLRQGEGTYFLMPTAWLAAQLRVQ